MKRRLAADTTGVLAQKPVELVPLDELLRSDSPRLSGDDIEHARVLSESDTELPPILVNRRTMRVVDGAHRVLAAELRGADKIEAEFCECDEDEAFVLAVRANVAHGLPLSLADRTAAARRIIASHGHWSDRAIASATGLAHKTIGSIRRRSSGEIPQSPGRRGRDGRVRPVNAADGRLRASRLLADRPEASMREIARDAGVCPATVRDVRARLLRGEQPVSAGMRPDELARRRPEAGGPVAADLPALVQNLRRDPSLRFSESGRTLLRLLEASSIGSREWAVIGENVPPHCAGLVASVARECGQALQEFAVGLEQRRGRQSSG